MISRCARILLRMAGGGSEYLAELDASKDREGGENGEQETEVADAVDDEGLAAGGRTPLLFVVVADQEIGTQPDALPADKKHRQVGAEHQQQHGEHEEVEVGEVAGVAGLALLLHVTNGVDVDQETDEGNEGEHHRRQRVELEGGVDRDLTGGDPGEIPFDDFRVGLMEVLPQRSVRRYGGGADRTHPNHGHHRFGRLDRAEQQVE